MTMMKTVLTYAFTLAMVVTVLSQRECEETGLTVKFYYKCLDEDVDLCLPGRHLRIGQPECEGEVDRKRICDKCINGYIATHNACNECNPWTECGPDEMEDPSVPPNTRRNRTCITRTAPTDASSMIPDSGIGYTSQEDTTVGPMKSYMVDVTWKVVAIVFIVAFILVVIVLVLLISRICYQRTCKQHFPTGTGQSSEGANNIPLADKDSFEDQNAPLHSHQGARGSNDAAGSNGVSASPQRAPPAREGYSVGGDTPSQQPLLDGNDTGDCNTSAELLPSSQPNGICTV